MPEASALDHSAKLSCFVPQPKYIFVLKLRHADLNMMLVPTPGPQVFSWSKIRPTHLEIGAIRLRVK